MNTLIRISGLTLAVLLSGCASYDYAYQQDDYQAMRAFSQSMGTVQMPYYQAPAYVQTPPYIPRQIIQQQPSYQQQQPAYQPVQMPTYTMPAYQQQTNTIYKTDCSAIGATGSSVGCTTIGY